MSPVTPDRQAARPTAVATNLQSTPQSVGSAARSQDLLVVGLRAPDVNPWITRDIENARQVEVDLMLKSFLSDCMVGEAQTKEALFNKCLESVLPICNSPEIKQHLEAYSSARNETGVYPAFVHAANAALCRLPELTIDSLRGASEKLAFCVNGDKHMKQYYGEEPSIRKPDVVLVSEPTDDCGNSKAVKPFEWRNIRTVVEFKYKKGWIRPPPSKYSTSYKGPTATRKYYSAKFYDNNNDEPEMASSVTDSLRESEPQSGVKEPDGVEEPDSTTSVRTGTTTRSSKRKATVQIEGQSQRESGGCSNQGSQSHSKRVKVETKVPDPNTIHPTIQVAMYGAEMLASHAGREHAICLLMMGDHLYVWRYDRQDTIQCSALNFIQDLPRFLVLLLAMQRFQNRHWGLNPHVDPDFGELPVPSSNSPVSTTMHIDDPDKGKVDITLICSSDKRVPHYGLRGRATNLLPVTSKALGQTEKLVAKLYWGEVTRTSEADILKKVYEIAEKEPDVKNHVPEMVFSHKFSDSSTATIRARLNLPAKGARVLYLIVFRELMPITKLDGNNLLKAWWNTVKCHLALWNNGVEHRDISPSNLMYKTEGGVIVGILNDFDLATIEAGPTGDERTGTVPFMAMELLTKDGLAGRIKHVYAYDAESFIWVLLWISLRYVEGKLRKKGRPLDEWLKVDALRCREKKTDFLVHRKVRPKAGEGQERNLRVANGCLKIVLDEYIREATDSAVQNVHDSFQKLLFTPLSELIKEQPEDFADFRLIFPDFAP